MADSKFGCFCSQWLLHNECNRGHSCIFIHANICDVNVLTEPTDQLDFVKGIYEPNRGRKGRNRRNNGRSRQNAAPNSQYANNNGSCSGINMPSTSSHNSASSSASTSPNNEEPAGSSTGSKKKTKHQNNGHLPHTITSGALERDSTATVKDNGESSRNILNLKTAIDLEEWVKAPEFIPRGYSTAPIANSFSNLSLEEDKSKKKLCPYAERGGLCKYPPGECTYLHGILCELCSRAALHPYNEEQRKQHTQECIKQHERDMELSFAIARSKEKICGICFETIMQKVAVEQRFGILPNCNHCFCLTCIRRWRQAKQFENKIIRACPECRVTSDFVCPSTYWVDTKEEKEKVIENYKQVLSKKDCKYFKKGSGSCPFGNKCFYLHSLNDGTKVDVGPPPSHKSNDLSPGYNLIQRLLMLGYLRDNLSSDSLEFDDLLGFVDLEMFSDTDESVFSDCDFSHEFY